MQGMTHQWSATDAAHTWNLSRQETDSCLDSLTCIKAPRGVLLMCCSSQGLVRMWSQVAACCRLPCLSGWLRDIAGHDSRGRSTCNHRLTEHVVSQSWYSARAEPRAVELAMKPTCPAWAPSGTLPALSADGTWLHWCCAGMPVTTDKVSSAPVQLQDNQLASPITSDRPGEECRGISSRISP